MPNFKQRSNKLELMDMPIHNQDALLKNLKELVLINTLTGGPSLVFNKIKTIALQNTEALHVVDIGFGAGDLLHYLEKNKKSISSNLRLTGVDIMPETRTFVQLIFPELVNKVAIQICDFKDWFASGNTADIITANLFCHHLTNEQLVDFLVNAHKHAQKAIIINDLYRHPVAYWGIKIPTFLFAKSYYTKHDAPLSVLRGFKRKEWESLLQQAGIKNYSIEWKWAFRYLITIYP